MSVIAGSHVPRPKPAASLFGRRGVAALSIAVVLMGALTACSLPNLSMSSKVAKTKPTPASPSAITSSGRASAVATTTSSAPRAAGDLDTGSVTHKVAVGAFSAVIVYYTADNAKLYRDSSTKTIRVAVHIEGADSSQAILVNDFVATADDGTTREVVKQDSRSFAITPPQSYNSVVTIPASKDASTALTLIVEIDFSLQITPTSTLYAAQTALDDITLPLITGSQS
jgi:hypothetical protein